MLIKYIVPLDRYAVNSALSADVVRQRLQAASQADMPLVSMPEDAAPWQGEVTGSTFKLRNAIRTTSRGRTYSAIVSLGRIQSKGNGSRIVAWQRFSLVHMAMMFVAFGFALALTGLDFSSPVTFLPAAVLWLLFVVAFQISSARQRRALIALATAAG
ncbi:hypothetical protein [Asticcacaulis solisilvae]|uniref:hypothetical protein n=1 Tax=Asticcacaulis solisilvae TaxID=1217274 RepID=UPI003FD7883C